MEMWHNGEQASGVTIAVGATKLRSTAHRRGFHHICPTSPPLPLLSLSLLHSLVPLPLTSQDKNVMFKQEF